MSSQIVHPLMKEHLTDFDSFEAWKSRWDSTNFIAEKLGLLHGLVAVPKGCGLSKEAASFLLEIADGYRCAANFGEHSYQGYGGKLQVIAQKAMAVLCAKFFSQGFWCDILENEKLFGKVLWFLRDDRIGYPYNYRRDDGVLAENQQKAFEEFLLDFAKLGWEYGNAVNRYRKLYCEDMNRRMTATRPDFINILYNMGKLGWLNRVELDRASIAHLTKLAMGQSYSFPPSDVAHCGSDFRKPKNLQEAVLGGSMPAQVVILYRVRHREAVRLKWKNRISCNMKREKDRLATLAHLKETRRRLDEQIAHESNRQP